MKLGLIILVFIAQNALAEDIFYIENSQISSVDCAQSQLVLKSFTNQTLQIRSSFPQNPQMISTVCKGLQSFAGTDQGITLLTTPIKMDNDFISQMEVVGYVDVDLVVAMWSGHDPQTNKFLPNRISRSACGTENRSSQVCIWTGDNKSTFVSLDDEMTPVRFFATHQTEKGPLTFDDGAKGHFSLKLRADRKDKGKLFGTMSYDGQSPDGKFMLRKANP